MGSRITWARAFAGTPHAASVCDSRTRSTGTTSTRLRARRTSMNSSSASCFDIEYRPSASLDHVDEIECGELIRLFEPSGRLGVVAHRIRDAQRKLVRHADTHCQLVVGVRILGARLNE